MPHPTRRNFLRGSLATTALGPAALAALAGNLRAADDQYPRFRKAVKFGMIGVGGSIEEKFALIKSIGFEGVEFDAPGGPNPEEARKAVEKTGVEVHGVIDAVHWQTRLSDPSAETRAKALEVLRAAIKDCKAYGGTTVLLVPGSVTNEQTENFEQAWERSQAEIRKAIPDAKAAGVKIAIEVVWNNFLTKPEQMVKYVDEFNDPTVGAYFDPSNVVKFGVPPAEWIRQLGHRLLKFDFKAYSKTREWDVKIGEGDEDWPEVRKALGEIKYDGWATAEVGAGGKEHLQDVAARMDKVLGIA